MTTKNIVVVTKFLKQNDSMYMMLKRVNPAFRIDNDPWGSAINTSIQCYQYMANNGIDVPAEYDFFMGVGNTDPDDVIYPEIACYDNNTIIKFAEFMHNLLTVLGTAGFSY